MPKKKVHVDNFKYLIVLVNSGVIEEIRNCSTEKKAYAVALDWAKEHGYKSIDEMNSSVEYELSIWEKTKDGYEKYHGLF